jgi:hypothetical protein
MHYETVVCMKNYDGKDILKHWEVDNELAVGHITSETCTCAMSSKEHNQLMKKN